ncbi:MAG TPA: hypothetical protein VL944_01505 [Candidatus Acidoferrum sp.]|nr:hypothetical protein [Candidatus Acidoferrum sp.]
MEVRNVAVRPGDTSRLTSPIAASNIGSSLTQDDYRYGLFSNKEKLSIHISKYGTAEVTTQIDGYANVSIILDITPQQKLGEATESNREVTNRHIINRAWFVYSAKKDEIQELQERQGEVSELRIDAYRPDRPMVEFNHNGMQVVLEPIALNNGHHVTAGILEEVRRKEFERERSAPLGNTKFSRSAAIRELQVHRYLDRLVRDPDRIYTEEGLSDIVKFDADAERKELAEDRLAKIRRKKASSAASQGLSAGTYKPLDGFSDN